MSGSPLPWESLGSTNKIRDLISTVIPGFGDIKNIDQTGKEFNIRGRILHSPQFPLSEGKAQFKVCLIPAVIRKENIFTLMIIRSEGRFNTVVYELEDRYRGVKSRNVVFMNIEDIKRIGLSEESYVKVKNETGVMERQKLIAYPIKQGKS